MRFLTTLLTLLIAGCTAAPQHCKLLKGLESLEGRSLVAQIDFDSALARLLDDPEPLPPEPRQALVRWFEGEWHETTRNLPSDATVWWFKESKGGLGYRQGIVAVQDCHILRLRTLTDDN